MRTIEVNKRDSSRPLNRQRNKQKKQAEKQSGLEFSSEPVLPCDRVLSRYISNPETRIVREKKNPVQAMQPIVIPVLTKQIYRFESRTTLGKRDIYAR